MDYKYIEQLLDRYWACETTLEEEAILRSFFSQSDVPAHLRQLQPLFAYMQEEPRQDVLSEEFDERLLALVEESEPQQPHRARRISLQARLMPLFKAAAVVAIFLSLGNALQMAFEPKSAEPAALVALPEVKGPAMAKADSTGIVVDTLKATANVQPTLIK